jgi:hypothetical protein
MNSLFGEFFPEGLGFFLGVCETIWGGFWGCFGGVLEGFYKVLEGKTTTI